ncbi:TPA: host cell division inhibitor Icd-like protein [Serratia fonticola]|nr:host cell division inhibitor Icd-like protein [Serratia fonticola]HBE9153276.1 host cell division inhibitor Icd-like protein [Serratia fonticola]
MADIKSTQTRPKYHFRFLAIDRVNQAATPCRMSVEAYTEQEARQALAPHFILSFAARLPVQEVSHA